MTDQRFRPPMNDEDAFWLRFQLLENTVDELKLLQETSNNMNADLAALYSDGKAVLRVLVVAGKVSGWILAIFGAASAVWLAFKGLVLLAGSQKP